MLFAFRGFPHDPESVLTAVHQSALMSSELVLEVIRRSLDSMDHIRRHFELLIAVRTDCEVGCRAHTLYDSHGAFFHAFSLPQWRTAWLSPVEIKRHHYPKLRRIDFFNG